MWKRGAVRLATLGAALAAVTLLAACTPAKVFRVSGTVTSGIGEPAVGVSAKVVGRWHRTLAATTTDSQGRYELVLRARPQALLAVQIEADGYWPWQYTYGAEDLEVNGVLQRKVDHAFLEALATNRDAGSRFRALREVLAAFGGIESDMYRTFPYLGALREDLQAAVRAGNGGTETDQQLARIASMLLVVWNEAADRPLVQPWLEKNPSFLKDHPEVSGKTPKDACEAWVPFHFAAEHQQPPWTAHVCSEPSYDRAGDRALIVFAVVYEHWSYGEYLVFVRGDGVWKLHTVVEAWIT